MAQPAAPQTKGTNYIPTIKFLRSRREEALAALPAELHHYLEHRLLPSSWYPEAELMTLLRVLVALLPGPLPKRWELVGEQAADAHFSGAYATFVQRGPQALVESCGSLWGLLHDTGQWQIDLRDGEADVHLSEFPSGMPEYGELMAGYLRRLLVLSGATEVESTVVGRDASSARWHLRWTR